MNQIRHAPDVSNSWPQPQYSAEQQLQLEEQCAYLLHTQASTPQFTQSELAGAHRRPNQTLSQSTGFSSRPQNRLPASATTFRQQEPTSFAPINPDPSPVQWDSNSTLQPSSLQAHTPPVFPQGSPNVDNSNYQSQFSPFHLGRQSQPSLSTPLAVVSNGSSPSYITSGPMQFPYSQSLPRRQSQAQAQYLNVRDRSSQNAKRPRPEDDDDPESPHEQDNAVKQKLNSACGRCRGLKVRCEFTGDNDVTCRRCLQAGHECTIPDRRPRRRPLKREFLLQQIRTQASQIEELMRKLEQSNHAKACTPVASPSDIHFSLPVSPSMDAHSAAVVPKPEVQDWIAKARESLQTFGGLLPTTNSGTDSLRDPNGYASDDEDLTDEYSDNDSGYDTADDKLPTTGQSPTPSAKKKDTSAAKLVPNDEYPFGLLAHMSIKASSRQKSEEPEASEALGVANVDFFRPSPAPDPIRTSVSSNGMQLPHILARDIVTVQEADKLFDIYFKKMNPSTSLLDCNLHTPQYVAVRSPFLFTVMCGIASRFYTARPQLYEQLMQYVQLAAGTALISGTKNEEMCAGYLLMQLYPVPSKRWEEERSWIYLGVGIRIALDINLNRPITAKPLNEHHARSLLSRTRIWLNCFNLDRSTGSQYGKRPIIPNTDYVACHSQFWWCSSQYNLKGFDIQLCMYNMELRLMADFLAKVYSNPNHPMGLNKGADFTQLASETDDSLRRLGEKWFPQLDEFDKGSSVSVFRSELLKMSSSYQRLVALSAGLKYAKKDKLDENLLTRCLEAASEVVNAFVRRLFVTAEQKVYLRHAPEGQFVFVTFAAAFLVKLLRPKYAQYFPDEKRKAIRSLVQEAANLLREPDVAVDEKHAPYLYSRFLDGLLINMTTPDTKNAYGTEALPNGATVRKRPSAKGKARTEAPTLHLPQDQDAMADQISSASPVLNLSGPLFDLGYSSGPGSTSSLTAATRDMSSTRSFSGSPLPSPLHGMESYSPQEQPCSYQSMSSPSAMSTSTLIDSNMGPDRSMISSSELIQAPMPFDAELLESIQLMRNPVWQDMPVPGFQWMMSHLDTTGCATDDYALFETQQYGSVQF